MSKYSYSRGQGGGAVYLPGVIDWVADTNYMLKELSVFTIVSAGAAGSILPDQNWIEITIVGSPFTNFPSAVLGGGTVFLQQTLDYYCGGDQLMIVNPNIFIPAGSQVQIIFGAIGNTPVGYASSNSQLLVTMEKVSSQFNNFK